MSEIQNITTSCLFGFAIENGYYQDFSCFRRINPTVNKVLSLRDVNSIFWRKFFNLCRFFLWHKLRYAELAPASGSSLLP